MNGYRNRSWHYSREEVKVKEGFVVTHLHQMSTNTFLIKKYDETVLRVSVAVFCFILENLFR